MLIYNATADKRGSPAAKAIQLNKEIFFKTAS